MKWFWITLIALTTLLVAISICAYLVNLQVRSYSADKINQDSKHVPQDIPPRVAIVYGAAVYRDGKLSDVLYDRVYTAVELYKNQKVKKLLMSGDNSRVGYDEPTAMKAAAVKLGVPENDIVLDFAGRRTYDTCYRAKEIFGIKTAVHVTQEFHLARAIYLCENMGVDSIGVKANRRTYRDEKSWEKREFLAVLSAWFETNFYQFEPIGGKREPIE